MTNGLSEFCKCDECNSNLMNPQLTDIPAVRQFAANRSAKEHGLVCALCGRCHHAPVEGLA